jgi:histidyl-tRNA synthetase
LDSSKSFLFLNFGLDKIDKLPFFIDKIREKNITCEIYPSENKIKKQMDYANQKGINYVVIIGEDELKNSIFKIKDMSNGTESTFNLNDIVSEIEKLS